MSDLVRDLRVHKTMSQFLTKEDLYQSLNEDRAKAADHIAALDMVVGPRGTMVSVKGASKGDEKWKVNQRFGP